MELRRKVSFALLVLSVVLVGSILGYRVLGGPSVHILDALYMAVITLAGVGYGENIATAPNPPPRVFNMFVVVFGGMITVYVFSSVTAFVLESEMTNNFSGRHMPKGLQCL